MAISEISTTKNKELTKKKLILSVGTIIRKNGYSGLGVNAIAKEAGVDKKLIYRYFGDVNKLIETYVIEKDYWLSLDHRAEEALEAITKKDDLALMVSSLLENQLEFFYTAEEMQKLILWQISERVDLLNSICKVREDFGEKVFEKADKYFKSSNVNFRAVSALLVGGIYFMVLHAKKNDSKACGIDINSTEGRKEIIKAIRQIVTWSFNLKGDILNQPETEPERCAEAKHQA